MADQFTATRRIDKTDDAFDPIQWIKYANLEVMVVYGGDEDWDGEHADLSEEGPEQGFEVELCSHETILVQTDKEQSWFIKTRDAYLTENKFTDSTDLQDVDRLLVLELQLFRWTQYIASGRDNDGIRIDEETVRKQIKEVAEAITKVKASLGLDKSSRDKAANEGNFAQWFEDTKRRAKLFGLHRENQLKHALALMNEIGAQTGAFLRSNEEERIKLGIRDEAALIAWINDDVMPRYRAIDEHFVTNSQAMWNRDL